MPAVGTLLTRLASAVQKAPAARGAARGAKWLRGGSAEIRQSPLFVRPPRSYGRQQRASGRASRPVLPRSAASRMNNIGAAEIFTIALSYLAMAAILVGLVLLMKAARHRH